MPLTCRTSIIKVKKSCLCQCQVTCKAASIVIKSLPENWLIQHTKQCFSSNICSHYEIVYWYTRLKACQLCLFTMSTQISHLHKNKVAFCQHPNIVILMCRPELQPCTRTKVECHRLVSRSKPTYVNLWNLKSANYRCVFHSYSHTGNAYNPHTSKIFTVQKKSISKPFFITFSE